MSEKLYSRRQIADLLGVSRQAIYGRAKKEGWPIAKTETKRGGSVAYHSIKSLPKDLRHRIQQAEDQRATQRAIAAINEKARRDQQAYIEDTQAEREQQRRREEEAARLRRRRDGQAKFAALPKDDPKRKRAEARRWLVEAMLQLKRERQCSLQAALTAFADQVNQGEIPIPEFVAPYLPVRGGVRHLVADTLKRWHYAYYEGGIWALTDGYGNRKGKNKIEADPRLRDVVLGLLVKYPHIRPRRVQEYLKAKHPELACPSERTIARYLARWKQENRQLWAFISHPDQFKNVYLPAPGSHFGEIERLNQLWELDSTPGDWLLTDGRHIVVGAVDLYSRRLKLFVAKTSSGHAVGQLLRRAILDWGVPEAVRTDNGKDYVSDYVTALLRDLNIQHQICLPFASEQKGTIERHFRTMAHGVLELLPGFCGHNVAERKRIEARKSFAERVMTQGETIEVALTAAELQKILDDWCAHIYEHTPHQGLGGRTPREVARHYRGPVKRIEDERALDGLLMPVAGTRVIGKKGILFEGRHYMDRDGRIFAHIGEEVYLRRDENDIGRLAVFLDGRFLCWAENPDVAGFSAAEVAAVAKRHVFKLRREQAKAVKALEKQIKQNPAEAIIEDRKRQAENVIDLPHPAVPHDTDALAEAARMMTPQAETPPAEPPSETVAELEALMAEPKAGPPEDDEAAHRYWMLLRMRLDRGETLPPDTVAALELYENSQQCRSMRRYFEEFGLSIEAPAAVAVFPGTGENESPAGAGPESLDQKERSL